MHKELKNSYTLTVTTKENVDTLYKGYNTTRK
jgi:hypothetical protein